MKKAKPITFHIISLFPESLTSYINESIISRAQKEGLIKIKTYNPRDFVAPVKTRAKNSDSYGYRHVDDRPYGGGPGMVIQALPVANAIKKALGKKLDSAAARKKTKIIFLSPKGKTFSTEYAKATAEDIVDVVIVCGRYEGIDARVLEMFSMEAVSIGPYVLTGGELPALIMIDCISRQIPGVLGKQESLEENRVSASRVYTRPEKFVWKKKTYKVPEVLLSGHQKKIDEWKMKEGSDLGDAVL